MLYNDNFLWVMLILRSSNDKMWYMICNHDIYARFLIFDGNNMKKICCTCLDLDDIDVVWWTLLMILNNYEDIWWFMFINDDFNLWFHKYNDNHA